MDQVIYWDYLKVNQLLDLQHGLTTEDDITEDELHFIIVHQVFELWFKLAIAEVELARDELAQPSVEEETIPGVVHHLKRVNTIMQLAKDHFKLMETLTPQDFLEFRSKLGTASGFQSYQFRIMEMLLGLQLSERGKQGHSDPSNYITSVANSVPSGKKIVEYFQRVQSEKSLRDALHDWLYRTPIHGSSPSDDQDSDIVNQFVGEYLEQMKTNFEKQIQVLLTAEGADETKIRAQFDGTYQAAVQFLQAEDIEEAQKERISRIRAAILFIESYRKLPLLAWPRLLIDSIVELEELMVGFRFHHARMVERVIGRRIGTGGSSGVDYLDKTTKYRIFTELWAVRTVLLPLDDLPQLKNPEFYKFVTNTD